MTEIKKRGPKPRSYKLICDNQAHLKGVGFDLKWLETLAVEYQLSKLEYVHKFRAFRCYQDDRHVDWVDINDLSLLNGGRRLEEILLKHQPVSLKRAVIKYPWR
jgi:hypothetical protein